jgi:patatin-related protein
MFAGHKLAVADPNIDAKAREVRLGLVLYGGVSLAIYINGVMRECFRIVRGQGVYRLLKALTDSDVVVDVVSGTSAGGINGILLAYALCNNKDFAGCARLWRTHGGILNLLRSPRLDPEQSTSLLDSEGYYQDRLQEAFATLPDYVPEQGEDNSQFDELDLFVTGTDVDGSLRTQFDHAGHPVDVKDHRTVFLLKHRLGRKEPFAAKPGSGTTHEALAKLARITSCFPAAFAPVLVTRPAAGDDKADALLQEWGALGKEACFLDGGVLDNKPFTHTIKAIFRRSADREVRRTLFFVEPDPEHFAARAAASQPNFMQAVLASLLSIPGYESIADDLKLLAEHNSKVKQYRRLVGKLGASGPTRPPAPPAESDAREAMRVLATSRELYRRSRLVAFSDRVVQGLFRTNGRDDLIPTADQASASELVHALDVHFEQLPEPDANQLFQELDAYYRLRRLYRVIYLIYDLLYSLPDGGAARAEVTDEQARWYWELWRALNRQVKLYEVLVSAVEGLLDRAPFPWKNLPPGDVWRIVHDALYRMLAADAEVEAVIPPGHLQEFLQDPHKKAWLPQAMLTALNKTLQERAGRIASDLHAAAPAAPRGRTLVQVWEEYEQKLLAQFLPRPDDPVRRAYDSFEDLDRHLYPLEVSSGLQEKDVIEAIRISPRDANQGFSRVPMSEKVAGTGLHHFGGFFKRSWRANDILWGRLDGLCQLVESLLKSERLEQIVRDDRWRDRLRHRFFKQTKGGGLQQFKEALDPRQLFPRAGKPAHDALAQWLRDLLDDNDDTRRRALDDFEQKRELLIEAAQLEVLGQEVPQVIEEAIDEQTEWNRFQVAPPAPAGAAPAAGAGAAPYVFEAPGGALDPLVVAAAAAETQRRLQAAAPADRDSPRPAATSLGTFFRDVYRVGSETWDRDIPTLVLLQVLGTALLVLRNCVLGVLGPHRAAAVRGNLLYKFGVDYPLRAFHAVVLLALRDPAWLLGVFFCCGVVAAFALLIGITWRQELLYAGHVIQLKWVIVFIILPAAVLVAEVLFLLWYQGGFGWRRCGAFLLAAAVAVALFVIGHGTHDVFAWPPADVPRLLAFTVLPGIILLAQAIYLLWLALFWAGRASRRGGRAVKAPPPPPPPPA